MSKNMDRRGRKTRTQLRQGLAELLKEKSLKEITVKELVEKVDINRSTFYLHYADIYDMMEKIENELTGDIEDLIHTHPVSPFNEDSFPFIEDIFSILAENRDICAALLGPNGDISFLHRIENILSEHSLNALKETFPEKMDDLACHRLARDIRDKIEAELTYPGQIKVTVIRETRACELAK